MIRARDEERTLGECLQSILPFADEILVVNHLSRDGTKQVAERIGAQHPKFKIVDYTHEVARPGAATPAPPASPAPVEDRHRGD